MKYDDQFLITSLANDLWLCLIKNIESVITRPSINDKQNKEFSKKLSITKEFCKDNQSVFFTRAHKGNVTVCLNVDDYK